MEKLLTVAISLGLIFSTAQHADFAKDSRKSTKISSGTTTKDHVDVHGMNIRNNGKRVAGYTRTHSIGL